MASKVVSLGLHKNTLERRTKRERAKAAVASVAGLMRQEDIRAYAFVGISAEGKAYALWDTGAIMPARAFPHVVAEALSDDIHNANLEDDWRPSLPIKGSAITD